MTSAGLVDVVPLREQRTEHVVIVYPPDAYAEDVEFKARGWLTDILELMDQDGFDAAGVFGPAIGRYRARLAAVPAGVPNRPLPPSRGVVSRIRALQRSRAGGALAR